MVDATRDGFARADRLASDAAAVLTTSSWAGFAGEPVLPEDELDHLLADLLPPELWGSVGTHTTAEVHS